jgi:signal transduction histidine kinase
LVERRLDRYYRQALSSQMVLLSQRLHGYLLPFPPSVPDSGLAHMQQNVRIAPIHERGRVLGTVTVIEDVTERHFNEAALRARAKEQAAVASLSQLALARGDLNALFQETTRTLVDVFAVDFCHVLTPSASGDDHQSYFAVGANQGALDESISQRSETLTRYTLKTGNPVIVEDLATSPLSNFAPGLQEKGITSAACVPIFGGMQPYGAVAIYQSARRVFSEEVIRVLQAIANMLGFAIERNRLENLLRQRADDLAGEAQRKDEFLAMLAHELRNPLAPIRHAVQIIRLAGDANTTVERASEIVERQVQHMVHLVDDLLDVSRISRGKIQLRQEKIELSAIIVRAVESVRPLIDVRNQELTITQGPHPIWLEGDLTRLVQVVTNLLNNAAKYTDAGGHIWLTAAMEGEWAVLSVRDNGIGIRADVLPRIFDLFVQSDRALDRAEGGLGIGLTLARNLVEMHRGSVTASSGGLGKGSEFVVRIPALPYRGANRSEVGKKHEIGPPSPSARRRVLIVDDNVDAAQSLAMLLQLYEHNVRVVHDGKSALVEVSTSRPEVVFLDIGLPGMNGYQVASELRSKYGREILLVAMTGYGHEEDRRRSQEAGFDGHLVKPVELNSIIEFIKRAGSDDR